MKNVFLLSLLFTMTQVWAQKTSVPQIGSVAPSFSAMTTNGKINFPADFGNNWKILFSHPKDFTPVCSSEILELADSQESFEKLGVKLAILSTDNIEQHKSWKAALEEISYKDKKPVKIDFPLIEDNDMKVSKQYGMIHNASSAKHNIRGVYFIDPENNIRAIQFYPNEVGRNIDELKRTLIALQTNYSNENIFTPANWQEGDDVIVPVLTQEERDNIGKAGSAHYEVAWFMVFKQLQ